MYRENGCGWFPVDEKFVFDAAAGVGHTSFFGQKQVHERVLTWLGECVAPGGSG